MYALAWTALATLMSYAGLEFYENMSRDERVEACVIEIISKRPDAKWADAQNVCDIVVD